MQVVRPMNQTSADLYSSPMHVRFWLRLHSLLTFHYVPFPASEILHAPSLAVLHAHRVVSESCAILLKCRAIILTKEAGGTWMDGVQRENGKLMYMAYSITKK